MALPKESFPLLALKIYCDRTIVFEAGLLYNFKIMIQVFKPFMQDEEIREVARVIKSGWIGLGPETEKFEKNLENFIGRKYIVSTNSATAALHLALIVAGVKDGDEVISPALSFVSTNHVILYQRATPVFCDIDPDTLCADPLDIERKISKKTKAIILVHYGGHAVDMDPVLSIAKKHKIAVIEDSAHALGGTYKGKMLGTLADLGCYSFHAVKGVAMADGGAIFTPKKIVSEKLLKLRWMGINKDTWKRAAKGKYSWHYDVESIGFKYHTNDILSAMGNVQLKRYPKVLAIKRKIYENYNRQLSSISWLATPVEKSYTRSALHNYCIKTKFRDKLSSFLAEKGIASTVHYIPNNHYKMYKEFSGKIPVTEKVWKKILLLPFHPALSLKEQGYIIDTIKKFKP